MKKKYLEPAQLIAMIDYPPLHSPEAFVTYHNKLKSNNPLEPIIVIPKKIVIGYLVKHKIHYNSYKKILEQFLLDHPKAKYFMMGGKHRSAAATILGVKICSIVVENDRDIGQLNSMMEKGEITGVPPVGKNLDETLQELEEHYFEHKRFWTMDEKTKKMLENGDISVKI